MRSSTFLYILTALFLFLIVISNDQSGALNLSSVSASEDQSALNKREAAYRASNIGAALLEQYKAKEAADSFTRALEIKPELTIARINLGIALYYLPDTEGAKRETQKALGEDPNRPQSH